MKKIDLNSKEFLAELEKQLKEELDKKSCCDSEEEIIKKLSSCCPSVEFKKDKTCGC